jgi:hypothetical protein
MRYRKRTGREVKSGKWWTFVSFVVELRYATTEGKGILCRAIAACGQYVVAIEEREISQKLSSPILTGN